MIASPEIREWGETLRGFASVGMSVTQLFLVPPDNLSAPIPNIRSLRVHVEPVTSIPDGDVGLQVKYFRGQWGLTTFEEELTEGARENGGDVKSLEAKLAADLSTVTDLDIAEICQIIPVSRTTFYNWQRGQGISNKHLARVKELIALFRRLRSILDNNLSEFVHQYTPLGKPLDLLRAGETEAVIGLALRSNKTTRVVPAISAPARAQSNLPGWLRLGQRLSLELPRLSEKELLAAAARLNPPSIIDDSDTLGDTDPMSDDEPDYTAYGFLLE